MLNDWAIGLFCEYKYYVVIIVYACWYWNLTQLEKGKKNSKIRDRQPRDIEKEIVDRGEYSYKNNLRELIHIAISDYHPKNMEQFKKLLARFAGEIFGRIDK